MSLTFPEFRVILDGEVLAEMSALGEMPAIYWIWDAHSTRKGHLL